MKNAFVFRLARLLRHRRRVEEARALALRHAIQHRDAARARQVTLEHAVAQARAVLNAHCTAGVTGASLRLQAEQVRDLQARAGAAETEASSETARVEERRAELVDAARDRKALERLEEIQRAAWHMALTRGDQRATDEIATSRARRSS